MADQKLIFVHFGLISSWCLVCPFDTLFCDYAHCRSSFPNWHWTCFVYCKRWSESHKRMCQTSCMTRPLLLDALLLWDLLSLNRVVCTVQL